MEITVEIRNVYGNKTVYPVCNNARLLCDLAGTKTFTRRIMDIVKKLGYTINIKQNQTTL
jgi:hypothetical protein